jgi:hypothetical protein
LALHENEAKILSLPSDKFTQLVVTHSRKVACIAAFNLLHEKRRAAPRLTSACIAALNWPRWARHRHAAYAASPGERLK